MLVECCLLITVQLLKNTSRIVDLDFELKQNIFLVGSHCLGL